MNSDVMMERVLNGDIVVIVNITVLMAPTSSTVVSHSIYSSLSVLFSTFNFKWRWSIRWDSVYLCRWIGLWIVYWTLYLQ